MKLTAEELVDLIEQAFWETGTALEAAALATERILDAEEEGRS